MRGAFLVLVAGCRFHSPLVGGNDDAAAVVDAPPPGCIRHVEARRDFSCAVRTDGTAWCWGHNEYGKLGDGTLTSQSTPVRVAGLTNIVEVALASRMAYALDASGTVYAWGLNDVGQLGDGTQNDHHTAMPVAGLTGVTAIRAGRGHVCAIAASEAYCWGWNSSGQIGDGLTGTNRLTPYHLDSAVQVAAGGRHTCILRADHTVACTGKNAYGELGDGTQTSRATLATIPNLTADEIAAGGEQTCARKSDGSVWCWGDDIYGELATGGTSNPSPVQVPGVSGATKLMLGGRRSCVRKLDRSVWCWGEHPFGVPNTASNIVQDAPSAMVVFADGGAMTAAAYHICGVDASGTLLCTGHNLYGQVGDGSTMDRTEFVPVQLSCP